MPARNAKALVADTLAAVRASIDPGVPWELIVVDDGSSDATGDVARRLADRVIRTEGAGGGPARARNAGAQLARGEWLLFLDADVRVTPETLRQFWRSTEAHPSAGAIFGAYDARPAAPGLVSRYRNLLHRFFHLQGAGPAETFWAGLGGVRAEAFRLVGGFDPRYARPQVEDIEFGYRLREAGIGIVLDPRIEGTHLKGWTLRAMVVTDFRDRALPWMRLWLEAGWRRAPSLNTSRLEQLRVAATGAALAAGAVAVVRSDRWLGLAAVALLAVVVASRFRLFRWLFRAGGLRVAIAAVPLQAWYYLSNSVAAGVAVAVHAASRVAARSSAGRSRAEGSGESADSTIR
jgi:glycosyltransferase involved in cell wall biosynthesis